MIKTGKSDSLIRNFNSRSPKSFSNAVASLAQVQQVRPNLSIFRPKFSNLSIFDFCRQKGKLRGI